MLEPWEVQRVDHERGDIVYEVWSVTPCAFLFGIHDDLTPNAKAIAESIVADHNRRPAIAAMPSRAEVWNEAIEEAAKHIDEYARLYASDPDTEAGDRAVAEACESVAFQVRRLATKEKGNG